MVDLAAIKARLAAATPGPWTFEDGDDDDFCSAVAICAPIPASERQQTNFAGDFNARAVVALTLWQNPRIAVIHDARWDENAWLIAHAPTDIAALVAEVERLRSEVERLRAIVPTPPKTPPPGEVWRHSGTFDIDGTDFAVDLVMVGAHQLIAYYPSNNQDLRNRCGYSPHPGIWMDGAIYWEDGLIATEQEEDFCAEVVEALIRYIQEHGEPPDDFGDLGLDTFGRDVGLGVSGG